MSVEIARRALGLLDLTNLEDDCTESDIDALCAAAETPFGNVAAVCVWPKFVEHARTKLKGTSIKVATVASFPEGDHPIERVLEEVRRACFDGAHEIDLVLDYKAFAAGDQDSAIQRIVQVRETLPETVSLKIIIESGELKIPELIRIASVQVLKTGVDFIKTSTGKVPVNATPEAAQIMIDAIHDSERSTGFKAAGGVRTVEDAATYLEIADRVMGPDWATGETFRFGASSLLKSLIAAMEGSEATLEEGY